MKRIFHERRFWLRQAFGMTAIVLPSFAKIGHAASNSEHELQQALAWPQRWLQLVVKYQQNPLRAARSCSYLLMSMHSAWQLQMERSGSTKRAMLSMHRAACSVLQHFYPYESAGSLEALYAWGTRKMALSEVEQAECAALGDQLARTAIDRSLRDGAGRIWPISERPVQFDGMWQPAYPLYAVNPTEAYAGHWRTWASPSATRYVPPPPARPGMPQHAEEAKEVWLTNKHLDEKQKQTAQRWHLDQGSVTPPGVWLEQTILMLSGEGLRISLPHALEVLAMVGVAMHDAMIACWQVKFQHWSERPITAIRRLWDVNFVPLLVTPGFPGYVSGHACVSAAAAGVLASFWPQRTDLFTAMAREAAMSRLWGGIHFRSDNDQGLLLGTSVANDVLSDKSVWSTFMARI